MTLKRYHTDPLVSSKKYILLIDDAKMNRKLMSKYLAAYFKNSYKVVAVSNSDEALGWFGQHKSELAYIVCDGNLLGSKLHGPQLADQLLKKAGEAALDIPLFAWTTDDDLLRKKTPDEAGASSSSHVTHSMFSKDSASLSFQEVFEKHEQKFLSLPKKPINPKLIYSSLDDYFVTLKEQSSPEIQKKP